jgi:hypothetical protein
MKQCLLSLVLAALAAPLSAAVLTNVPMQGSMLMPTVWYHADTDSVTVGLDDIIVTAQLTPLLVSHPGDSFDPADPWFDSLDPSQQGLAFSRRYGFVMHAMTDFLPFDRELWIRKISSTPGLSLYDYNDFVSPKSWNPVFGTDGASNACYWSGLMWHVGVAAPPGTNPYSAVFEIFVRDLSSGQEVPGSSSGPFVLDWTNVPDGRPALEITAPASGQVLLAWPAVATNWTLVTAPSPAAALWSAVSNSPTTINGQSVVELAATNAAQHFRMKLNQ